MARLSRPKIRSLIEISLKLATILALIAVTGFVLGFFFGYDRLGWAMIMGGAVLNIFVVSAFFLLKLAALNAPDE